MLGINFKDVVRILAAILLLGNVDFLPKEDGFDVEIVGNEDLESVANLLGVPVAFLKRGLTTRTRNMGGQLVLEKSSANVVSECWHHQVENNDLDETKDDLEEKVVDSSLTVAPISVRSFARSTSVQRQRTIACL